MPLTLDPRDVIARLALAFVAAALIGLNRGERGHAAGLRTTLLVCVAACASMIQVNLLLVLAADKQSLVTLDLMRLPLGILSGMGFIGAGAIMRKGELVRGVTTAATLWFVTVIGLCFGGGQLSLGLELTSIGVVVLWGLKWIEERFLHEHRASLILALAASTPTEGEVRALLSSAKFEVERCAVVQRPKGPRTMKLELRWRTRDGEHATPHLVAELLAMAAVRRVTWEPKQ